MAHLSDSHHYDNREDNSLNELKRRFSGNKHMETTQHRCSGIAHRVHVALICTALALTAAFVIINTPLSSWTFNLTESGLTLDRSRIAVEEPLLCPQVDAIHPVKHGELAHDIDFLVNGSDFKAWAYESLAGAVKIPCVCLLDIIRRHI